jgi:hypothetical protein
MDVLLRASGAGIELQDSWEHKQGAYAKLRFAPGRVIERAGRRSTIDHW